MKKWLLAGSALLFIQIILAATLNSTGRDFGPFTPREKLLGFSPATVDRITITDSDSELTILKKDGEWQLPGYFTAPADANQVRSLLDRLADLKQGLVVASSKGSAERFKVGEDNFEKHLIIASRENVVADFFVGASPGFKKVYARVAGRPHIVTVALNSYDLETEPEDWLDQEMLRIDADRVAGLAMGNFKLNRHGGTGWQLTEKADGEKLDQDRVAELIGKIADLRIKGLAEPAEYAALFASDPELSFTVSLRDGEERGYTFVKPSGEDYAFLRISSRDHLFRLDKWRVDEIARLGERDLLKSARPEEESGAANS